MLMGRNSDQKKKKKTRIKVKVRRRKQNQKVRTSPIGSPESFDINKAATEIAR